MLRFSIQTSIANCGPFGTATRLPTRLALNFLLTPRIPYRLYLFQNQFFGSLHLFLYPARTLPNPFWSQTRFSATKSIEQPRHDFVDVIVFCGITHDIS